MRLTSSRNMQSFVAKDTTNTVPPAAGPAHRGPARPHLSYRLTLLAENTLNYIKGDVVATGL